MRLKIPEHPELLGHAELVTLVGVLKKRLLLQEAELDELRRAAKRQASPYRRRKKKTDCKRPGRKANQGTFAHRGPPALGEITDEDESDRPASCPCCGGTELEDRGFEDVFITELPALPRPQVKRVRMWMRQCQACSTKVRGSHADVADDQRGATAHRLGPRVKTAAIVLHYGRGIPQRKVPAVLADLTGVQVTQGALAQDAVKRAKNGPAKQRYEELRGSLKKEPVVHTDDTGFCIGAKPAQLMCFTTPDTAQDPGISVFQIRHQHRNEEVRELIPADFKGTMVTDRGAAYDARVLAAVKKQKCLPHVLRNLAKALEQQTGAARDFGTELTRLFKSALELRRTFDSAAISRPLFDVQAAALDRLIGQHLACHRRFTDLDNRRLHNELGRHYHEGSLTRFLRDPSIATNNNLAERELRPAVVARKVSHCVKTETGARAHECLISVVRTEQRAHPASLVDAVAARLYPGPSPTSLSAAPT